MENELNKTGNKARANIFGTVFFVWCFVIAGVSFKSGPVTAAYGVISVGAIFFVVAIFNSLAALGFVFAARKDWRAWAALGLCILAVLSSVARFTRAIGP